MAAFYHIYVLKKSRRELFEEIANGSAVNYFH